MPRKNKAARKAYEKEYREKYPDRVKASREKYQKNNKDKCTAATLDWRRRNREKFRVNQKNWEEANKAKRLRQDKSNRRNRKLRAIEYKGGKCVRCGYSDFAAALDFHHVVNGSKSFSISNSTYKSWDKIRPELDKCILLCSNCHRGLHAGNWKLISELEDRKDGKKG